MKADLNKAQEPQTDGGPEIPSCTVLSSVAKRGLSGVNFVCMYDAARESAARKPKVFGSGSRC